ncbi:hypothetical protein COOONC_18214 [Cooperia oncophora]
MDSSFRLCSFIPKIAAANDSLMRGDGDAKKLDVDIHKVSLDLDESDTSSSDEDDSSDDSIDSETECGQKVKFDLSLFREDGSSAVDGVQDSLTPQEVDLLPEAFRERENDESSEETASKSKKLIEEL